MLPQFSVRKPYTVLVAVVLVLVLGVISFTGMTTDLLPAMDCLLYTSDAADE